MKYEQALSKINEAFGSIAEYKSEVSDLMPRHKSANEKIKELITQVETHKQEYIVVSVMAKLVYIIEVKHDVILEFLNISLSH